MYNKISVNKQMCIINDTAVIRENMQYKNYVLNYTKLYIVYIILNMAVFLLCTYYNKCKYYLF